MRRFPGAKVSVAIETEHGSRRSLGAGCFFFLRTGLRIPIFPHLRRREFPVSSHFFGAIAQLGERYNGIVEVVGSIPSGSTKIKGLSR